MVPVEPFYVTVFGDLVDFFPLFGVGSPTNWVQTGLLGSLTWLVMLGG